MHDQTARLAAKARIANGKWMDFNGRLDEIEREIRKRR
jgi:hypothetical protein